MIDGKYKVKIIDLQDKYRFKIFCGYDDAGIKQDIEELQDEIDTINTNLALYSLITQTGYSVELELNNTNYQLSAKVKNKNGTVLSTSNIIDLPIESMIVDGSYDSTTKSLILILQNGNTITIPLADIISGLVDKETFENAIEEVNTTIDNLDTRIEEEQSLQDQEIENLKTLRNILPKVSGSGESITLDNTGETTMDIDLYGNTSQDGEPTPDTPQPIHSVSGDNTIEIAGKNLFDYPDHILSSDRGLTNVLNSDGSITTSGTLTSNYARIVPTYDITDKLEDGETYTLSMSDYYPDYIELFINKQYIAGGSAGYVECKSNNVSFSVDKSAYRYRIGIQSITTSRWGSTNRTFTIKYQLEKGSTATSFEPYLGNKYPINLPIENLLALDSSLNQTFRGVTLEYQNDGGIKVSGTSTSAGSVVIPINIPVKGVYRLALLTKGTISTDGTMQFQIGDSSTYYQKPVVRSNILDVSNQGEHNLDTTLTRLMVYTQNGITYNCVVYPMYVKGEYTETNFPSNVKVGETPLELNSIGDYKDTFKLSDGTNLFDIQTIVKGRLDNGVLGYVSDTTNLTLNDNSFSFTASIKYRGVTTDYIEVESGTYILSTDNLNSEYQNKIACYDVSKNWLQDASFTSLASEKIKTITIPSGAKYVRIYFALENAGTITINKPQFEKGSTATPYQPYGVGKWYLEKVIQVIDKNEASYMNRIGGGSDENYTQFNFQMVDNGYPLINSNLPNNTSGKETLYCNMLKPNASAASKPGISCICLYLTTRNLIVMVVPTSVAGTNTELNTYLSSNTMKIMYPINGIGIPVTDETLISQLNAIKNAMSKKGQTNISQVNNDLPFELDVIAFKDMSNL